MTSLEERYKKAYANFEKAAAVYYPLLDAHREAMRNKKGFMPIPTGDLEAASDKFRPTIVEERVLDEKLRAKLNRDIDKMPLPLDVRRIVKEYVGPLNEPRTEPVPQAAKTMKYTGGRKTRKSRKTRSRSRRA